MIRTFKNEDRWNKKNKNEDSNITINFRTPSDIYTKIMDKKINTIYTELIDSYIPLHRVNRFIFLPYEDRVQLYW